MREAEIPESDEDGFQKTSKKKDKSVRRLLEGIILASVVYGVYTAATVSNPVYMMVAMFSILLVGLIVFTLAAAVYTESGEISDE